MNIVDICRFKYPGQIEAGNIIFSASEGEQPIIITTWNVQNEEQPTEASLLLEAPLYQPQFDDQARLRLIAQQLPNTSEMIDALWDLAVNADNTKLNAVEAARQAVFAAHPAPE